MPSRTRSEELDRAIDAVLRGEPADAAAGGDEELSSLVEVAGALRGLPREGFRAQLSATLRPAMVPHDLREAAKDLPLAAMRRLGNLEDATIGLFRFNGQSPWERHPGDELILVLDGGGEVTLLAEEGPVHAELRPGRLFVCPRGLWHRTRATPSMTALYVTPLVGSEISWAEDPRVG
jgi:hypothetical protein